MCFSSKYECVCSFSMVYIEIEMQYSVLFSSRSNINRRLGVDTTPLPMHSVSTPHYLNLKNGFLQHEIIFEIFHRNDDNMSTSLFDNHMNNFNATPLRFRLTILTFYSMKMSF